MEAAAGGDGGGNSGGDGGDKRLGRDWDPTDPGREAKRPKNEDTMIYSQLRDLKAKIQPFQKQLSEMETEANDIEEIKTELLAVMKERDYKLCKDHPDFWSRVMCLAPSMKGQILSADTQMFQELKRLQVTESTSHISFQFDFKANNYFENQTLVKSYPKPGIPGEVRGSKVVWKERMDPSIWIYSRTSFFEWFSDTTPFQYDIVANDLVRLYREPLLDVPSDEEDWIGKDPDSL